MITIYADVLVCLNVLITYIFLVCCRLFTNNATNKWGVAISSVVGGLSSLIILAGDIGVFYSVLFKVLTSVVIVLVAFLPESLRRFVRVYLSFIGISVLFGGVMYFTEITLHPHNIMYFNGTVYFDVDIKFVIGCTFLIYGVFVFLNYIFERKAFKNEIYKVTVTFRGVSVVFSGYVDTCNNLKDVLTGKSVFVCELKSASPLFTYEETNYFKRGNYLDNIPDSLKGVIRFVPCKTVYQDSVLTVFTPDKTEITSGKKIIQCENVCIGVINKNLSDGEYNILLNKNIFDLTEV